MGRKKAEGERVSVTTLKGSAEWAAWLGRVADHDRNSLIGMIDRAVIEYARRIGYQEEAPKR